MIEQRPQTGALLRTDIRDFDILFSDTKYPG